MLDQAFTAAQLLRTVTGKELSAAKRAGTTVLEAARDAERQISKHSFAFPGLVKSEANGKPALQVDDIRSKLVLNKLTDNLRRVLRPRAESREHLIAAITSLLKEKSSFQIFRTDIHRFFDSIQRRPVLKHFVLDNIDFSADTRWLIEELYRSDKVHRLPGLPRGIGPSAILSDAFMQDIDNAIITMDDVYFYGRYVDDIVVFTTSSCARIKINLETKLKVKKLKTNPAKTFSLPANPSKKEENYLQFSYLGYEFVKRQPSHEPIVRIAPKKLKKMKTRIALAFRAYGRNGDFILLRKRIKFLTTNFALTKARAETHLRSGIYYNYNLCTDARDQINELDHFLKKQIFSRRNIAARNGRSLTGLDKQLLKRYSFSQGFYNKLVTDFSFKEIRQIEKCWRYA